MHAHKKTFLLLLFSEKYKKVYLGNRKWLFKGNKSWFAAILNPLLLFLHLPHPIPRGKFAFDHKSSKAGRKEGEKNHPYTLLLNWTVHIQVPLYSCVQVYTQTFFQLEPTNPFLPFLPAFLGLAKRLTFLQ